MQQQGELTEEDVEEWTRLMRENFRKISLKYMCSRAEAWEMLVEEIVKTAANSGDYFPPDDIEWVQEVLSGLREPTIEECKRRAARSKHSQPLQTAMANLLGDKASKKDKSTV